MEVGGIEKRKDFTYYKRRFIIGKNSYMKKFVSVVFACVLCAAGSFAFADEVVNSVSVSEEIVVAEESSEKDEPSVVDVFLNESDLVFQVENLVYRAGVLKNRDQVSSLSEELSLSDREAIYSNNAIKRWPAFTINILAGFGIGSFVQHDIAGGVTGLVLDVIGTAAYTAGLCVFCACFGKTYTGILLVMFSGGQAEPDFPSLTEMYVAEGLMYGGAAVVLGSRIFQCIRPWVFGTEHNNTLKEALHLNVETATVLPVIDPVNNNYGFVAQVNF